MILDRAWKEGWVENGTTEGWFFDPYDPKFKAPLLSNIADKQEFDTEFPNSPLSRLRNVLLMIKENLKFSDVVKNSEYFYSNLD